MISYIKICLSQNFYRAIISCGVPAAITLAYFTSGKCPECGGERLNQLSRSAAVMGTRLPELVSLSLEELHQWLLKLEGFAHGTDKLMAEPYLLDLKTKIQRNVNVGLGYLSLDRQTMTTFKFLL